jgi:hypothetical protein
MLAPTNPGGIAIMTTTHVRRLAQALAITLVLGGPAAARAQSSETIIEWNRQLMMTLATPGATQPTVFFTRGPALMHVAVFEALNSFDRTYTPYLGYIDVPAGASRVAAVAQAAHDTLAAMYPSRTSVYDAALVTQLALLPPDAAQSGARVGAAAARAILDLRADDGWQRRPPAFVLPTMPGYWQPVPPGNAAAAFTHYPDVVPFVIGSANQFPVEPPPALTSRRYADDFNEVKAIGGAASTTRTADQTLVARLFAAVPTVTTTGFSEVWNNLVRDLSRARGLDDIATARLYALINTAFHDALFVSFSAKYHYGFWRPVTAIREAARDGNPDTEADPGFLGLIPSPAYPTYPGNVACYSAALSRVLARYFDRDDIAFSVTWAEPAGPGITRAYTGFRQLADEAARSRVYGGIHFGFDTTASIGVCAPLGDYVFTNTFRRR